MSAAKDIFAFLSIARSIRERMDEGVPEEVRELSQKLFEEIVEPLWKSKTEADWVRNISEVVMQWFILKPQLLLATLKWVGRDGVKATIEEEDWLPEAAVQNAVEKGALDFAKDVARWVSRFLTDQKLFPETVPELEKLHLISAQVNLLELAILSATAPENTPSEVVSCAVWEAYACARSLAGKLIGLGFSGERMPKETPEEIAVRSLAILDRVAADWTELERQSFVSGLISREEELS